MRLITLMTIAGYAMAPTVIAAETTIKEALTGGTLSGKFANVAEFASTTDATKEALAIHNAHVGMSGLKFSYATLQYQGWSLGTAIQAGKDWEIHDKSAGLTVTGGEDDHRISVTSLNLQNLFIEYDFAALGSHTAVRYGRQNIISPLLISSGLMPLDDAWEGVVLTNNDIDKTTIKLMYISDWYMRYQNDASTSVVQTDKHFSNPVGSLYIQSKAIEDLTFEAQWLSNHNDGPMGDPPTNVAAAGPYDSYFVAADYQLADNFWLGGKYTTTDFQDSDRASMYGLRAATMIGPVRGTLSYISVNDDKNLPGSLGHVPAMRSYNGIISEPEVWAGVDIVSISLNHNFDVPGLAIDMALARLSQSQEGQLNSGLNYDNSYKLSMDIRYQVQALQGLSLRAMLGYFRYDDNAFEDNTMTASRFFLDYTF